MSFINQMCILDLMPEMRNFLNKLSGFFSAKPALKNRSTVFTLGSRGEVLTSRLEEPIIVPHAQQKSDTKVGKSSLDYYKNLHYLQKLL